MRHNTGVCFSFSGLTLTKRADGVISFPQVDDVTMSGLGGDVVHQGGRDAVSVLHPQHFGGDGEPQVTCGQNLQSWGAFIHHNLGDAVVDPHDGDLHGLRVPGLEHGVGKNVKVSVCAVSDSKGEGVLWGFGSVVFVADEVFIEVLFGEAGDGRWLVVEDFAMNRQLGDGEFQLLLSGILVLGGKLKWCNQFHLPFCDN